MELNIDCVRDILMVCEDTPFLSETLAWEPFWLNYFVDKLPKYSKNQIAYTISLLGEAGYLKIDCQYGDNNLRALEVSRLTYKGHELLDSIKPEKIWTKVLKTLGSINNVSLPILQDIASDILKKLVS